MQLRNIFIMFFHQMNNTTRPKNASAKYHVQLLDLNTYPGDPFIPMIFSCGKSTRMG